MKLTIKTSLLKELLGKADKCISNNKMLPLTCMMCISVTDNKLTLVTTDGSNYLYVMQNIENENFYAVVNAETFIKLVNKTTSENMSFEVIDEHLDVVGNGKYSIELPPDENGLLIKFPNPLANARANHIASISKESIELILKTNKAALSTSFAEPCYTGYYLSDRVITSDRSVICCNDLKIFDEPRLINPEIMNVLSVFNSNADIDVTDNNEIIFCGKDCIAYGHLMNEIDDYNAEAVIKLILMELPYKCELNRQQLINSLDRLSLFISMYDKNAITLSFKNDYLELTNVNSNAVERVKYAYINEVNDVSYTIDVEMLKKQISVQSGDVVELWYGNDIFIKLVDGDTTQLLPLLVE